MAPLRGPPAEVRHQFGAGHAPEAPEPENARGKDGADAVRDQQRGRGEQRPQARVSPRPHDLLGIDGEDGGATLAARDVADEKIQRLVHVDAIDGDTENLNTRRHRAPTSASG